MKKIINLKESLLSMDKDTDCRYDLTNLYEACNLDDKKKRDLAKYITAYDIEGTNKFLSNEASSMGLMENTTDDLSDEEFEAQVTEGFIHMTDDTTCNPLVMGANLKAGDLVYDEKTGNQLKVLSVEPNSNWSRNIQFINTTTNEPFVDIVGNNSFWEVVAEGDTAYEVDDDIDIEFHLIDELTSQLNEVVDEEPVEENLLGTMIGSAIKGAGKLLGEDLDTVSIEQEVKDAMYSILEPRYDTDFVNDYCSVSVEDTEDNVIVRVNAELEYDALFKLGNELNKVITKYDPKTYFEAETSGRLVAYIRKDQSDDIVDEEAVKEWTAKFNACKTRDELISVYKELVNIYDNGVITSGTIEVLFDVIDVKSDELDSLGESLNEDINDIEKVISKYNDAFYDKDDNLIDCGSEATCKVIAKELNIGPENTSNSPVSHVIYLDNGEDTVTEAIDTNWDEEVSNCKTLEDVKSLLKKIAVNYECGNIKEEKVYELYNTLDDKLDEIDTPVHYVSDLLTQIESEFDESLNENNKEIKFQVTADLTGMDDVYSEHTNLKDAIESAKEAQQSFMNVKIKDLSDNSSWQDISNAEADLNDGLVEKSLTEDYMPDDDDYDRIDRNGSDEERLLAAITYQYGVDMDTARKYEKELSDQEKTRALKWYDLRMFPPKIRLQKMEESLNEDNEPEKYIKLDLQEPEYDHFTIGGKEVPYKSHEEAKAHLDDFKLKDYEEELYKYLKSKDMYPELYVNPDNTLSVHIEWGDWKHDHQYIDSLINNFFFNRGLILDHDMEVTEDDSSDTYSATHYYTVSDVIFSMSMKKNNTLGESVEHNYRYVITEGVFNDIKNVAKSVGKSIKNNRTFKRNVQPTIDNVKDKVNNSKVVNKVKDTADKVANSEVAQTVKNTDTAKGVKGSINSNKFMSAIRKAQTQDELNNIVKQIQDAQKSGQLDANNRINHLLKTNIKAQQSKLKSQGNGNILNMDESLNEDFDPEYLDKAKQDPEVRKFVKDTLDGKEPIEEDFYDDDFTDEEMAGLLGGELMYCPDCGSGRYYDGHCYACGDPEEINESTESSWTDAYEQFSDIVDTYFPDETKINDEVEKLYNQHKGDTVWDEAYKRWCTSGNDESLNEELWNSSRVSDLVTYYLDQSNVPINTLAQMIMKQMKEEGSKLPFNITDFYDALYMAVDRYNSDDDLNEGWVMSLSDATKDLSPMDKDGFYKVMDNITCDPSKCPLDQLENEVSEIAARYTDGNASPDYEGEDFYDDEYSGSKIYNAILKLYGRDNKIIDTQGE